MFHSSVFGWTVALKHQHVKCNSEHHLTRMSNI